MLYEILKPVVKLIFKEFYRLQVRGQENIPEKGRFILVANHCSFLDPLVLVVSLRKRIYWVARRDLYQTWWLKVVLNLTGCIPVNGAVKEALEALEQGKVMGLFPEGTRSWDGRLMKGMPGAAILALKTGAPILPAGIKGTFEAYPRTAMLPGIHPIRVRFGKLLKFGKYGQEWIDSETLSKANDQIMKAIAELID